MPAKPLPRRDQTQRQALAEFVAFAFTDPRVAAETGPFTRPTLMTETHPVVGNRTLEGAGAGAGYATVRAPIPADPALVGLSFYGQWWIEDTTAINGSSATQGLQVTIF